MKYNTWLLCFFSLVLLFSSCKKKKSTTSPNDSLSKESASKIPALKTELADWPQPFWTAKAKVAIQHPGMNVSFQMSIRSEKDQRLWFSAQALGFIEVARGIVTRDSIIVLDKFNNNCYVGGLDGLESYVPFPLGISQLQHFLMGRVFWDSLFVEGRRQSGDSTYLSGNQGDIFYSGSIWQRYFLTSAQASTGENQTRVSLSNSQFKPVGNTWISYRKELQSSQLVDGKPQDSGLKIEFTRFEFVGQRPEMELEIPSGCERKLIK